MGIHTSGIMEKNCTIGDEVLLVYNDLDGVCYDKFINYALLHSDIFMFVIPYAAAEIQDTEALLKDFPPEYAQQKEIRNYWLEKEEKSKREAKTFKKHCVSFIKELHPYLVKQRYNNVGQEATVWPSTKIMLAKEKSYSINFYRTDSNVLPILLKPQSYLKWRFPLFPEDLSFFRKGRCWVLSSSHEEYIEIYPNNEQEYIHIANMGIKFYETNYVKCEEEKLYYEADI